MRIRKPSEYRNYGRRARAIARWLDLLAAPLLGLPGDDSRRSAAGSAVAAHAAPARMLLIRPDHIGDLLIATPAIRALRQAQPGARIDLLCSPWGAPALHRNPDVDEIHTVEATWFEPKRGGRPGLRALAGALRAIRRLRYDAAADLRGDVRSILMALASGARVRAGFSRVGLERALTDTVPLDPALDWLARNHAIVRLLGAAPLGERRPVFVVSEEARAAARGFLSLQPREVPAVAVFPGTNKPAATWGAERFAAACRLLAERRAASFVICGREADRAACEVVEGALQGCAARALSLAGRTSLDEAAAVIEASAAALANDSGAAHLAVAVGTPVVTIFGPTNPDTLWRWEPADRYVALAGPTTCQRPCFRGDCPNDHGYSAIEPARVAAVLERLLALGAASRP